MGVEGLLLRSTAFAMQPGSAPTAPTSAPSSAHGRRTLELVLAVLLLLGGALELVGFARRTAGIDAYHFWAGSRIARGSGARLYEPTAERSFYARLPAPRSPPEAAARRYRTVFHATHTPFFWAASRAFFGGDYATALLRWQLLSVAALFAALALLAREVGMAPVVLGSAALAMVGAALLLAWTIHDLRREARTHRQSPERALTRV